MGFLSGRTPVHNNAFFRNLVTLVDSLIHQPQKWLRLHLLPRQFEGKWKGKKVKETKRKKNNKNKNRFEVDNNLRYVNLNTFHLF